MSKVQTVNSDDKLLLLGSAEAFFMAVLCGEGVAMLLIEVSCHPAVSIFVRNHKLCERLLG